MNEAFICDAVRTPFGRYGGALSSVRTDVVPTAQIFPPRNAKQKTRLFSHLTHRSHITFLE